MPFSSHQTDFFQHHCCSRQLFRGGIQAYGKAISELKSNGKCPIYLEHRQVKYLNNIIESDHGKLKRLIKPTLGFKSMKTAYATIKGFEIMRMFKNGRFDLWNMVKAFKVKFALLQITYWLSNRLRVRFSR